MKKNQQFKTFFFVCSHSLSQPTTTLLCILFHLRFGCLVINFFRFIYFISSNLLVLRRLLTKTETVITLAGIAQCGWIFCRWQRIFKLIGR